MRTKEYVVCIRPLENALALQTMFFPDEVRSPKIVGDLPAKAAVKARELTMAGQLIDSLTSKWDPARYEDTHTKKVMALVRKKDQGKEIIVPEAEEAEGGKVVDLMDALKATLAKQGNGHSRTRGHAPSTRAKPGARPRHRSAHAH
jgi:DNA end-binding protein Ku